MTSFIKQKTATFSRPRIIVKYMDTLLTSKPLTTATPVDGYAIVDGDIVLFTNLSAINYTIHRATVTGVNITWTQLALGQSADGLPTLGDEVFIQAGTYTKKIYWYDNTVPGFVEFKSSGGIGDSSIFGYLNSQDDNIATQAFTTGNNPTFLTAGVLIGIFNQKNETLPLNGKSSYTYTQGALNDWIASYAISVPLKAQGVTNVTKFSYMYDGGNNDILPVVYDVTNSKILSSLSKFLENTNGVSKRCELVYDVPSTCSSIKIGFHVKVLNAGKVLKFDDIETGVWTPQAVNLVEQESVRYSGANLITTTGIIRFNNAGFNKLPSNLFSYDPSTGYFTPKKKIVFSGGVSLSITTSAENFFLRRVSDNAILATSNTTPPSASYFATLPFSVELTAGESVYFATNATLSNATVDKLSITSTAISENVVQSYQPSDRIGETIYLPQNVAPKGFISAMGSSIGKTSGTYQGDTYFNLYKVLWNVALNTAGQPYYLSSAKGSDALTDWNAGKTITIDESGLFTRAFKTGVTNGVGQKQDDAFQGHYHHLASGMSNNSAGAGGAGYKVFYSENYDTTVQYPVTDGTNGTPRTSNETRPVNVAKYVFIRYSTAQPDLLALPTSKENVFSAYINSTATVLSKSSDWITSSSRSSLGVFVLDYTKLGLTAIPSIIPSTKNAVDLQIAVSAISTTSATFRIINATGSTLNDADFMVVLQKQSPDYTPPGVFVGNVAKNQVAIVQYRGNGTRTTLSTSPVAMPLTTVKGDTQIVSISNNQFTLQAGEYDISFHSKISFPANQSVYFSFHGISGYANNSEIERGDIGYFSSITETMWNPLVSRITITTPSVFEARIWLSAGAGYIGITNPPPNDLNGFIKITKLNGN